MVCDLMLLHHTSQVPIHNLNIMVVTIEGRAYDVTHHSLHGPHVTFECIHSQNVGGIIAVLFEFGTLLLVLVYAKGQ